MTAIDAFVAEITKNETLYFVVLGLAALDLIMGAGRALMQKRFASGMLRKSAAKMIEELGLPMMLGIVGLADPALGVLVPAALWLAVVSEATSLIEQMKGKTSQTLLTEILKLLGSANVPGSPGGPTKGAN